MVGRFFLMLLPKITLGWLLRDGNSVFPLIGTVNFFKLKEFSNVKLDSKVD